MGRGGIWKKFSFQALFPTLFPHCHLTSMEQGGTCCWHAKTDPPEPFVWYWHCFLNSWGHRSIQPKLQWLKASPAVSGSCDLSDQLSSSVPSVLSTGSCTRRRLPAGSRPLSGMGNHCRDFRKKNTLRWCCLTALQEKTGVGRWGHCG